MAHKKCISKWVGGAGRYEELWVDADSQLLAIIKAIGGVERIGGDGPEYTVWFDPRFDRDEVKADIDKAIGAFG